MELDIDLRSEYRHIGTFYTESERLLHTPDDALFSARTEVSSWSPGRHLYHIWLANGMMLKAVQAIVRGHPAVSPDGAPNELGMTVLSRGTFPRGQAEAPDPVRPPEDVSRDDLRAALERSRSRYESTEAILPHIPDAQGTLPHAFLGRLTASQWLRLTRIHSDHHLTIVRDILG